MRRFISKNKLLLLSTRHLFKNAKNVYIFSILFVLIAMILQWAFQYEVLWDIISNEGLNFGEKIQEVFQAFVNLFILIDDITPISILAISLVQALAATMLISARNAKNKTKQIGTSALALAGMGCVSCRGSLLTPLLTVIASDISLTQAQNIGNVVLLISLVLSYLVLLRVVKEYANSIKITK